jgi:uncharacterized membrane protein YphA (DoxX/SURF4 family)
MDRIAAVNDRITSYSDHSYTVLRIGLGLVVFLAGLHKIVAPAVWAGYIAPQVATALAEVGLSGSVFMTVSGAAEAVFSLLLFADRYTTVAAGIVSLSFVGITINLAAAGTGFIDIIIRDVGLISLAFGVTLMAADRRSGGGA